MARPLLVPTTMSSSNDSISRSLNRRDREEISPESSRSSKSRRPPPPAALLSSRQLPPLPTSLLLPPLPRPLLTAHHFTQERVERPKQLRARRMTTSGERETEKLARAHVEEDNHDDRRSVRSLAVSSNGRGESPIPPLCLSYRCLRDRKGRDRRKEGGNPSLELTIYLLLPPPLPSPEPSTSALPRSASVCSSGLPAWLSSRP